MTEIKKPRRLMSKNSLANLPQNKSKTPEELEEIYTEMLENSDKAEEFNNAVEDELKKYEEAYDLSELMPNDRSVLRGLAQNVVRLEMFQHQLNLLTINGVTNENIVLIGRINDACDLLHKNISLAQADLKISRKTRRSDQEQSAITALEDLRVKARKFYEQKMLYVYCPKCGNLLGTFWLQYPDSKMNKMEYYCQKKSPEGNSCGERVIVKPWELHAAKKSSNQPDLLPERMK